MQQRLCQRLKLRQNFLDAGVFVSTITKKAPEGAFSNDTMRRRRTNQVPWANVPIVPPIAARQEPGKYFEMSLALVGNGPQFQAVMAEPAAIGTSEFGLTEG